MKVSFDFEIPQDRLNDPEFITSLSNFLLALGGRAVSTKPSQRATKEEKSVSHEAPTKVENQEGTGKKRGRKPKSKESTEDESLSFTPDAAATQPLLDSLEGNAKILMEALHQRGQLNMAEARALVGDPEPKYIGGTIGSVRRWSQQRGFYPPYIRGTDSQGQRMWRWVGTAFRTPVAGEASSEVKPKTTKPKTIKPKKEKVGAKLGRPGKNAQTTTSEIPAPPKKRGRPRKEVSAENPQPEPAPKKDGRGRPRKNPLLEGTPSPTTPPKKAGRGRPRKIPAATAATTDIPGEKVDAVQPRKTPGNMMDQQTLALVSKFGIPVPADMQNASGSSKEQAESTALVVVRNARPKKQPKPKIKKTKDEKKTAKPFAKTVLKRKAKPTTEQETTSSQENRAIPVSKPRGKKTATP